MSSTQRLELRQSQTLVMTPQLLQSIKLLQLSHLELGAFVEAELQRNPLLQQEEDGADVVVEPADHHSPGTAARERAIGRLFPHLSTRYGDAFQTAKGTGGRDGGDGPSMQVDGGTVQTVGLVEHLAGQLSLATADRTMRRLGGEIIQALNEAGYLTEDIAELAERLDVEPSALEAALALVQTLDPPGIGARNLAECLTLQLRERDRLDPPMQQLIARLDLVARKDFAALCRLCAVDEAELARMLAELRSLDPKPGLAFGEAPVDLLVPDVLVRPDGQGGFHVELNGHVMPRLLFDRSYHARALDAARSAADRTFLSECVQSANWLARTLDQRANTILKVAAEIVRRQSGFLREGPEALRPMTLKDVADQTGLHESTISRVTANKAIATPRGTVPMKYFFRSGLAGSDGEGHSSEAVRHRIRSLIVSEGPHVLSDDAIAQRLRGSGIDIARRTVAKYREAMRIPSSAQRRREQRLPRSS